MPLEAIKTKKIGASLSVVGCKRKMKIQCFRQTCDGQTDRQTEGHPELLTEPIMKIIIIIIIIIIMTKVVTYWLARLVDPDQAITISDEHQVRRKQ